MADKDTMAISVKNVDKKLWQRLKADAVLEGKTLWEKLNEVLRDRK